MRLENKLIFTFFLSDCRIVEEKKRYDKLNDAAYSALKCRDCAANVFFKLAMGHSFSFVVCLPIPFHRFE